MSVLSLALFVLSFRQRALGRERKKERQRDYGCLVFKMGSGRKAGPLGRGEGYDFDSMRLHNTAQIPRNGTPKLKRGGQKLSKRLERISRRDPGGLGIWDQKVWVTLEICRGVLGVLGGCDRHVTKPSWS